MPTKTTTTEALPTAIATPLAVEQRMLFIRGQKVTIDTDLAALYGVTIKRLNEQVRRNAERFPDDFMFPLTADEATALRSQFATLNRGRGRHQKYLPYAFTEHGALMAANVLNSLRAVEASVHVVRAFVRLREMIASHKELARKRTLLEAKYDGQFRTVFQAIRHLMTPPATKRRRIGFVIDDD